jgi:hypothetical protein
MNAGVIAAVETWGFGRGRPEFCLLYLWVSV